MNPQDLPDVHFGSPGQQPINWRALDDEDVDDEELEQTPEGVLMMLGFDPKDAEPDEAMDEFKEHEHKRDKEGKFSSTGGGGGSAASKSVKKNMGSSPKGLSKSKDLPALAKKMHEASGKLPTPAEFHKAAIEMGFEMIPAQSVKYLKMYKPGAAPAPAPAAKKEAKVNLPPNSSLEALSKGGFNYVGSTYGALEYKNDAGITAKYNPNGNDWTIENKYGDKKSGYGEVAFNDALSKYKNPSEAAAPAPAAEKLDPKAETKAMTTAAGKSATELVNNAATAFGYPKEGTYSGIEYWKAANGTKVSYKPDTDTWQASDKDKKVIAKGEGIVSLMQHVQQHPQEKAAVVKAGDPPFQHTQTSTAAAAQTSTASAKAYGQNIPHEKFSFTSKGVANEKALPPAVQEAIVAYKGNSWYHKINDAMRFDAEYENTQPKVMAYILKLERAFQQVAPSKEEVKVGRKIGMEAFKTMVKNAHINDLNDLKPGVVLEEPGIVSTSHSPHVWGGKVKFEITVPKGSRAVDISETINKGEAEVLLPPRSKFLVKEVKKNAQSGGSNFDYVMVVEYQK